MYNEYNNILISIELMSNVCSHFSFLLGTFPICLNKHAMNTVIFLLVLVFALIWVISCFIQAMGPSLTQQLEETKKKYQ